MAAITIALALNAAAAATAGAAPLFNPDAMALSAPDAAPPLLSAFVPVAGKSVAANDATESATHGPQVVRYRAVAIDSSLLSQAGVASKVFGDAAKAAGRSITLNLFDDAGFIADGDSTGRTARGIAWIGHLRGIQMSQVIIVVNGDVVAGNISMPGARYHIRYGRNGAHEVQEIDQSKFPDDEHAVPVPPKRAASKTVAAPDAQADDGSIVDVMVIYSATARAAAGGTSAMRAEIDLGIVETNQSYANSGIVHRVRLVHADEFAYKEIGDLDDALSCITATADGCLDGVHALRDLHAADLVSFWVEDGGASCGLGWSDLPQVSPEDGFSAVARECATGTYSFGHEMGHNMGAHHDVYVEPIAAGNPYGHGYVNVAAGWRTVMAYNDACKAVGKTCTRIQYWSNPALSYQGDALGNASADNHRILNASAHAVANFRNNTFVAPMPSGSGNYVVNPGFESGPGGWVQSTADLIWSQSDTPHSGLWSAWLGYSNSANHVLYQDVAIPANAKTASLQFWYDITTTETTTSVAYDFGTVEVVNPVTGATLVNLGTLSNLNVTNGWVQSIATDLTAYRGTTVRIRFHVTTDENKGTSFFFDDVALNVTLPTVSVVEFYNSILDNYFITSNSAEATAIDNGSAGPGWARSGTAFNFNAGGDSPVCRFYGSITPGPNSHFYTASAAECGALKAQQATTPATEPRWNFESLDFSTTAPVNGACPAGKIPVYRAYNNGFDRHVDSNHRITPNQAGISAVVARGWVNEGVVMCAPN